MGRETKLLLGFLGLLAGVFVGVLSMKLLVPRPPVGAGPDVHADLADAAPHDLVDPPLRTLPTSAFTAAPPLAGVAPTPTPLDLPAAAAPFATTDDPAAATSPSADRVAETAPVHRDPFVAATSFDRPGGPPPDTAEPPAVDPGAAMPDSLDAGPPADAPPLPPRATVPEPAVRPAAATVPGSHVAREGDTWWSLAERAYGDGRLYRALYAWNRTLDPRITLAPGTAVHLPPLASLAAAWPQLFPPRP